MKNEKLKKRGLGFWLGLGLGMERGAGRDRRRSLLSILSFSFFIFHFAFSPRQAAAKNGAEPLNHYSLTVLQDSSIGIKLQGRFKAKGQPV
ncbi:MAG: hypothetical protein ABIW76_19040, partial [Fibrobacteria bacterium]